MYKIVLTATVLTAACFSAFGQTSQGDRFQTSSGNFSYNRTLQKNSPTHEYTSSGATLGLSFQRGRFVRDDFAHGWLLGIQFYRGDAEQAGSQGGNFTYRAFSPALQVGYFARRYLRVSESVRFFAQALVSGKYAPVFADYSDQRMNSSDQSVSLQLQPGIGVTYFLKNGWALEAQTTLGTASLNHYWPKMGEPRTSLNANGSLNFSSFGIGIAKYFGGNTVSSSLFPPTLETLYQPGQRYIGGGFNTAAQFNMPGRGGDVALTSARFITANQARGLTVSVGFSNFRRGGSQESLYRVNQFLGGLRPFREYYWPLAGKWSVFLNAGLNFNYTGVSQKLEVGPINYSGTLPTSRSYQSIGQLLPTAFPGIQFQFAPRWALAATVGSVSVGEIKFDWTRIHSNNGERVYRQTNFNLGTPNLNLNSLGLTLRYFPTKKT